MLSFLRAKISDLALKCKIFLAPKHIIKEQFQIFKYKCNKVLLAKILKSENGEKTSEVKDNLFGDMSDMSTDDEEENPKGNEKL